MCGPRHCSRENKDENWTKTSTEAEEIEITHPRQQRGKRGGQSVRSMRRSLYIELVKSGSSYIFWTHWNCRRDHAVPDLKAFSEHHKVRKAKIGPKMDRRDMKTNNKQTEDGLPTHQIDSTWPTSFACCPRAGNPIGNKGRQPLALFHQGDGPRSDPAVIKGRIIRTER